MTNQFSLPVKLSNTNALRSSIFISSRTPMEPFTLVSTENQQTQTAIWILIVTIPWPKRDPLLGHSTTELSDFVAEKTLNRNSKPSRTALSKINIPNSFVNKLKQRVDYLQQLGIADSNETTALKQSPIMLGKILFTDLLLTSEEHRREWLGFWKSMMS